MCVYLDIVEKKVIKMALYFMLVKKKKNPNILKKLLWKSKVDDK